MGQAGTQAVLADPVGPQPGKQPGAPGSSRRLTDDPDHTMRIEPHRCQGCGASLAGAAEIGCERVKWWTRRPRRRWITEYQRISKTCSGCGVVTAAQWDDPAVPVEHAEVLAAPGSPVRIGPATLARCALLTCAHYLPVGRSRDLLERLTAIEVSTGFLAGVRGRAARRLERRFLRPHA